MANLGNAWHIPFDDDPRGAGGMLLPGGFLVAEMPIRIISGNQASGQGNAGNQLQDGSSVFHRAAGGTWTEVPMLFLAEDAPNKYYRATIDANVLAAGQTLEYYLRLAYD